MNRNCKSCSRELAGGTLECDQCHTLVHAGELQRLAAESLSLEDQGHLMRAREQWLVALTLLPRSSKQAKWIRDHVAGLELAASPTEVPGEDQKWARKLAPLGPVAVVLAKAKVFLGAVLKLKFLLSLAAFMALYWALYGAKFGVGFALLILVHEMGHFVDVKRRGLPADMPVFLPGLGAYVRWEALGVSLQTRAAVSLAGPLAGVLAAATCAGLWWYTGNGLWAALARAGAWLNLLNLIPVWILDGGQAVLALNKTERIVLLTACVALWLLLGESIFFLVAAGFGYQLFTRNLPAQPGRSITAYFLLVLTLVGLLSWMMPGQAAGLR